jgi:uncharacterized protein YecT (DUF1311 family)
MNWTDEVRKGKEGELVIKLRNENARLKERNANLEEKERKWKKEKGTLKDEIECARARIAQLEAKLNEAYGRHKKLRYALDDLQR